MGKRKTKTPNFLEIKPSKKYFFDEKAAQRAVFFIENYCHHVKGRWAGKLFILEKWQKKIIRDIFGWKNISDGKRRFREVYIFVPRKNGKSIFGSAISAYLLFADGEKGGEVYNAAKNRRQARIIFDTAKKMVNLSPALKSRSRSLKNVITINASGSVYEVLSADVGGQHGVNANGATVDELHVQPNRELVDVLKTSMGSREQPLMLYFTTAGYDRQTICWEVHERAIKVLKGIISDPEFYPVLFGAESGDDWTSPKIWKKANPNLNVSISEKYIAGECKKAKQVPAYENTFKRLHLNMWTQAESRWIQMKLWNNAAEKINLEKLKGQSCYAGLDLSSTLDITALTLIFQENFVYKIVPFFWIPGNNILDRNKRDGVRYDLWAKNKYLIATEGDVIDYYYILNKLKQLSENFNILEIAYDPWNASKIVQDIEAMDLKPVPVRQGYHTMSPICKEFMSLLLNGKIKHCDHPVLNWMADNAVVVTDASGNIKLDKSKSTNRIDGIVASVMALSRAIANQNKDLKSVYEERGMRFL